VIVDAAIWGFMDAAVSGSADTPFIGADRLNGLDGWRRVTRYLLHGKDVHLDNLRREMKVVIGMPIPSMDKLEEGVAEFENAIKLYEDAYGEPYNEDETKTMHLMRALPGDMGTDLIWKSSTPITRAEIMARREDFWSSREGAGGVPQIWAALRSAAEGVNSNNLDHANAVLEASSVTTPNSDMSVCYDELGNRYEVPLWCWSSPVNLSLSGSSASGGGGGGPKVMKCAPGQLIKCKARFGGLSCICNEIAFEGMSEAKIGALLATVMESVAAREAEAESGGGDSSGGGGTGEMGLSVPDFIAGVANGTIVLRAFFGGRELDDDLAFGDVGGIGDGRVVQLFLRKARRR
jgi:hypothetical protein